MAKAPVQEIKVQIGKVYCPRDGVPMLLDSVVFDTGSNEQTMSKKDLVKQPLAVNEARWLCLTCGSVMRFRKAPIEVVRGEAL